ncbi:hypothetical protein C8J57DRAFT_1593431 [Mycena rebaudengoi]|nr:hypothetical protein C8J57DRAFT_1593431 [Mycena rebaudengoi]
MPGIDFEVAWALTFGAERGSVHLPITFLRSFRIARWGREREREFYIYAVTNPSSPVPTLAKGGRASGVHLGGATGKMMGGVERIRVSRIHPPPWTQPRRRHTVPELEVWGSRRQESVNGQLERGDMAEREENLPIRIRCAPQEAAQAGAGNIFSAYDKMEKPRSTYCACPTAADMILEAGCVKGGPSKELDSRLAEGGPPKMPPILMAPPKGTSLIHE